MITLNQLQDRLRREIPSLAWACRPADLAPFIPGTEVPENIEIAATNSGAPVLGSPWKLNGSMLVRWGVDSTAKLIANHWQAPQKRPAYSGGPGWDKLAEI
jgi:hypothetical protein